LPDPTEWLGEGDLLMTVGLAIPHGAAKQRAWIELLAGSGISGVALCESGSDPGLAMRSPPLTAALREAADELGFPVLMVEHQVPFVALAHAVTDANSRGEHERLVRVMRLYDALRAIQAEPGRAQLLDALAAICGCELHVVDQASGRPPFPGWPPLPARVGGALADLLAERVEPLAAWVRIDSAPATAIALVVPSSSGEILVAIGQDEPLDPLLLQHAATIVAIEVERFRAEREHARRLGEDVFRGMLEQRIGADTALALVAGQGCGEGPWIVIATSAAGRWPAAARTGIAARLDADGVASLELEWEDALYCLTSAGPRSRAAVRAAAVAAGPAGVSRELATLGDLRAAVREARWALGSAIDDEVPLVDAATQSSNLTAPRSVTEAERIVEQLLGPLREYDQAHSTDLEHTLRVFLEENRSWQRAAGRLHVHKQTLIYRVRQVERLTGRSLSSTADVARLWIALEAAERLAPSPRRQARSA
jgi:purine catabolism regulator